MSEQKFRLISHHLCPYVQRAVIVLTEKAVPHERTYIDLANKPAWFRALSPLCKVPVLRVDDAVIFESAVICEYLEETAAPPLHPEDPVRRATHRSWIEFASAMLNTIAGFYSAHDAETFQARGQTLHKRLALLEDRLGDGPYFDGKRFHLVDAAWAPVLRYFDTFDEFGGFGLLTGLERVAAYRKALAHRASVRSAVVEDYPERLRELLMRRDSHFAAVIGEEA